MWRALLLIKLMIGGSVVSINTYAYHTAANFKTEYKEN